MDNRFHWHKKKALPHQREHEEKVWKKKIKTKMRKYARNGNEQISANYVNFMCFPLLLRIEWTKWIYMKSIRWMNVAAGRFVFVFFLSFFFWTIAKICEQMRSRSYVFMFSWCVHVWWVFHCSRMALQQAVFAWLILKSYIDEDKTHILAQIQKEPHQKLSFQMYLCTK